MAYKILENSDKFFVIEHPDGSRFTVPKKGISKQVQEQIEGYAKGGKVPFHGYNPEKHSRTGGLNDNYREKYNQEHGSNLKRPVTGNPKPGSEAAGRKKSFCARMKGVKGPTSEGGKLTPKGAALKRWNCHAYGGEIQAEHDSECEHYAHGGIYDMKDGGHVPGMPEVDGAKDTYKNDTVPAMLSPGEIVIPRSITMAENAPERAAEFVADILDKKQSQETDESPFHAAYGGEAKPGLYANIHSKRLRIEHGSKERMRKPGTAGAPTASAFKEAAKTAMASGGYVSKDSTGDQNMSYRIVKDAKDHYQVLHPDGSKFTVPKKGISKQMHEKIMGMEKFAVGGKVSKLDEDILDQPVASEMPDMDEDMEQPELPEFMRNSMDEMAPKPLPEIGERVPASVDASMMDKARPEARQIIPVSVPTPVPVAVPTPAPSPAQTVAPVVPMTQKPESTVQQPIQQTPESAKQAEAVGVTPVTPKPMAQPSMTMPMGGSIEKMQKGAMSGLPAYYDFLKTAQTQIDADQVAAEKRTADLEAHLKNQEAQANKILEQNKIDPGRKWSNMGIGNKILAGISIALGGIGAGLTGSNKNYALEIINKAIDDDIEAQKSNRDSAYNNLLQISKNREAVLAAQKADALQRVQNSINKMALQAKGLEAQQAAQKLWNDLEVQRITLSDKYTKELSGQLLTQYAAKGQKMRPEEIAMLPTEIQARFINNVGLAPSAEAAQKIRPVVADAEVIKNIVNQLRTIRQTYGREVMPLEASTMAQGLGQVLIGKLREPILGPGTMQEAEYERLKKLVPTDATAFFSLDDNTMARLNTIENMVLTNLDKTLIANNMEPKARPKMVPQSGQQGLQLNK
jgi:hypothetical protein